MNEKQLRVTNTLLVLILLVLIANLVVDLMPYYITGSMLGALFR